MERRVESLFSSAWWLVLFVAVVIGIPVIALGEVAGADARSRLHVAETNAASAGADRAAAGISDQVLRLRSLLAAVTQPATSGKLPLLAAAVQDRDVPGIQGQLETLRASLETSLPKASLGDIIVLDQKNVLVAAASSGGSLGSGGLSRVASVDRTGQPYAGVTSVAAPVVLTPIYRLGPDGASTISGQPWFSAVARLADPVTKEPFGSVAVLVNPTRFGEGLRSQVPAVDEAYLVDDRGRLIVRASRPFTLDPSFFLDLTAEPAVAAALAGSYAGRAASDPFGRGPRLASASRVADLNWRLIDLSLPTVASVELDSSLGQQRLVRIGLVALLLIASYLLARSARRTLGQRRALADANVRIAQANQAKSQFLATMSHELRTPLNAIIGFADVLGQRMFGELNAKQSEYVADIVGSGRHLLSLINDILDLAKVEAGRMALEPTEFSLREALGTGVTMVRERAATHGIALSLDVASDVDVITSDERKLKQIVFNLLSNAVKFTPDGGRVALSATRAADEVHVAVRDSGVGIATEDQDDIFKEFAQTESGRQSAEGTGLGLTLTKRLVELLGGRIWVESSIDTGSTFTFSLPMLVKSRAI